MTDRKEKSSMVEISSLERRLEETEQQLSAARLNELEIRQLLSALFASATWRFARKANQWVARLIGRARQPTVWDRLERYAITAGDLAELQSDRLIGEHATLPHHLSRNRNGLLSDPEMTITPIHVLGDSLHDVRDMLRENSFFELVDSTGAAALIVVASSHVNDCNHNELSKSLVIIDSPAEWSKKLELAAAVAVRKESASDQGSALAFCDRWSIIQAIQSALARKALLEFQPWFSERSYLSQNPDVFAAVRAGDIASGRTHWERTGYKEWLSGKRPYQPDRQPVTLGLRETDEELSTQAEKEISRWEDPPKISVIMPVYRVDLRWLEAAVDSVKNQLYPHWELCIADDASDDPKITQYLWEIQSDPRVSVKLLDKNVGISAASNEALAMATGEYVALLDHDDELTIDALLLVARVAIHYQADLIYSDEAKLDLKGNVVEPHFKPDFSPWLIQSQNYISHLGAYRRSLVEELGGFREGYDGSQDHDLLLRFLQVAKSAYHIPRILYYWRKVPSSTAARFSEKDYAWDAGVRAVQAIQAEGCVTEKGKFPGTYRSSIPIAGTPKVSILIPFRDKPELLDQCLESILQKTDYPHFEIIGIDNDSEEPATQARKAHWESTDQRIRFINFPGPFNYSAINNFGAQQASGAHLLLLNNDIEVITPSWLRELLQYSQLPGVGAVGAKLLYPDQTLQHAGVILGIGGVAGHSHKYCPKEHHGYFCRPHLMQDVSAVTGACLMIRRDLFLDLGGLNADQLAVAFNDIDICLRLKHFGFRNAYQPNSCLIHHESKTRGPEETPEKQLRFCEETRTMRQQHRMCLTKGDCYYNPNLTMQSEDFSVA